MCACASARVVCVHVTAVAYLAHQHLPHYLD